MRAWPSWLGPRLCGRPTLGSLPRGGCSASASRQLAEGWWRPAIGLVPPARAQIAGRALLAWAQVAGRVPPACATTVARPQDPAGLERLSDRPRALEPESALVQASEPEVWQEPVVAAQTGRDLAGCRPRQRRAARRARPEAGSLAPVALLRRRSRPAAGLRRAGRRPEEHSAQGRRFSPEVPAWRWGRSILWRAPSKRMAVTASSVPSAVGRPGLRDPGRPRGFANRPAPGKRSPQR